MTSFYSKWNFGNDITCDDVINLKTKFILTTSKIVWKIHIDNLCAKFETDTVFDFVFAVDTDYRD